MVSTNELAQRIKNIQNSLKNVEDSILLVTPGPNLRYLTNYKAKNLERLTCLAITRDKKPSLIVPELEKLAALDSGLNEDAIELITWREGTNPYDLFSSEQYKNVYLDEKMTADKVLGFQNIYRNSNFINAKTLLNPLRSIKSDYEIDQLKHVGKMIDLVHEQVPSIIKPGLSELEVAKIIGNQILDVGHDSVDFVIVASGHNSASPHHEPSQKVIEAGDVVVVDIGGTSPSGYCSDSTRTYSVGKSPREFEKYFQILKQAQEASCQATSDDLTGNQLDSVAREILVENGLGRYFTHRTGHGIGLETHEEPYIVETNNTKIVAGNAFSIEPGFYIENKFGARIEDILVKTVNGFVRCNETTRELIEI
jgi:Xaa-Pro aminopeptidase